MTNQNPTWQTASERQARAEQTTKALADVWAEGYKAGHSRAMRFMSDEPYVNHSPNPYKQEKPCSGA